MTKNEFIANASIKIMCEVIRPMFSQPNAENIPDWEIREYLRDNASSFAYTAIDVARSLADELEIEEIMFDETIA